MRNGSMQRRNQLRAMSWIIVLMSMTDFWGLVTKLLLAAFGE